MTEHTPRLLAIVGPTACGKTALATHVALATDGEILSGDSRMVYRRMDIGTGKDLDEYHIDGHDIPYHLIDIAEPGTKYNVYNFQQDFAEAYAGVVQRGRQPILCGGSGLYVEAVIKNYGLLSVPPNHDLRKSLDGKTQDELAQILSTYQELHNVTDLDNRRRTIRAIEIADYLKTHPEEKGPLEGMSCTVIGVEVSREVRRDRITRRLRARLRQGLVEEVQGLIDSGIPPADLIYYGLEYKYVTLYCTGQMPFDDMQSQLEIAIHQFAKRQMTWFRGMERRGTHIHWVDGSLPMETMVETVKHIMAQAE